MKKSLMAILLIIGIAFGLTGCGGPSDSEYISTTKQITFDAFGKEMDIDDIVYRIMTNEFGDDISSKDIDWSIKNRDEDSAKVIASLSKNDLKVVITIPTEYREKDDKYEVSVRAADIRIRVGNKEYTFLKYILTQ